LTLHANGPSHILEVQVEQGKEEHNSSHPNQQYLSVYTTLIQQVVTNSNKNLVQRKTQKTKHPFHVMISALLRPLHTFQHDRRSVHSI
jgi:hypothetical protein